jgi:hypothetical protein
MRNHNEKEAGHPNAMQGELERGVPTHMKVIMKMTTQGSTRKEDESDVG